MKMVFNDIEEKEDSLNNISKNILIPCEFFKFLIFDDVYLSQIIKNSNKFEIFKCPKRSWKD